MKDERQLDKAFAQRQANEAARIAGQPLPFPNPWDVFDRTKVHPESSSASVAESYKEFAKLCQKRPRKVHQL